MGVRSASAIKAASFSKKELHKETPRKAQRVPGYQEKEQAKGYLFTGYSGPYGGMRQVGFTMDGDLAPVLGGFLGSDKPDNNSTFQNARDCCLIYQVIWGRNKDGSVPANAVEYKVYIGGKEKSWGQEEVREIHAMLKDKFPWMEEFVQPVEGVAHVIPGVNEDEWVFTKRKRDSVMRGLLYLGITEDTFPDFSWLVDRLSKTRRDQVDFKAAHHADRKLLSDLVLSHNTMAILSLGSQNHKTATFLEPNPEKSGEPIENFSLPKGPFSLVIIRDVNSSNINLTVHKLPRL